MHTNQLQDLASTVASHIAKGSYGEFDLAALHSDAGLPVLWSHDLSPVVWHRQDDDTVVVWAGNDIDFDMTKLVEMPVPRGTLMSYATAEPIRSATAAELAASLWAEKNDSWAGVITVDGIPCYVVEG